MSFSAWPRTFSNPLAYIQSSKHTFAPVKVVTAFVVAVQVIAENQCSKKYEKWYKFESQFHHSNVYFGLSTYVLTYKSENIFFFFIW